MSWIALLLVGLAVSDLAHSVRPAPRYNEAAGAGVAVVLGLLAGMTDLEEVLALVVIAALVVLWGHTVTRAFGGGRPWVPLLVLGVALGLGVLTSPWTEPAGGVVGDWLDAVQVPVLEGLGADRGLLLLAAFLLQLSTGNVVVRLVLAATGTTNPAHLDGPETPDALEQQLKGGRLLGPMERVFILGLGLSGQLTAASIVVAAKGLLRWPELRSNSDQAWIHRLTEYFLVGSFVSWLVALSSLLLLAR
jgi:hypothetical protein